MAASATTDYRLPPQPLVDVGTRPPQARVRPDQEWILLLELVRIADGTTRAVAGLPRIGEVTWAPDSSHVAFTYTSAEWIELWVAEIANGEARRVSRWALNLAAWVRPTWLADSLSLVYTLVLEDRDAPPAASPIPTGRTIQQSLGDSAPARTFQDLLKNAHDEALFEHYLTSHQARVELDGTVEPLGEPAIGWDYDPSTGGEYLLTLILHRPFSYLRPAGWLEIWDRNGARVHQVVDLPLRENIPVGYGSVAAGPRAFSWRHDLVWVEALDGGGANHETELRDLLSLLAAPFTREPVGGAGEPPWGIYWGDDVLAVVSSWWWKTRNLRVSRLLLGSPEQPAELLIDSSWEDRYSDLGTPVLTTNAIDRAVLLLGDDERTLFLSGKGASPESDRSFVDPHNQEIGENPAPVLLQGTLLRTSDRCSGRCRTAVVEPPSLGPISSA